MRKYNSVLVFSLLCILFQNGWGSEPISLDEANLSKVADYYYRPGKETVLSSENKYYFLSRYSKAQMSPAEWDEHKKDDKVNYTVAVSVLGSKEAGGNRYAVVSAVLQLPDDDGGKIKTVVSHTWTLENGRWRNLVLDKTKKKFDKSFHDGDIAGAKAIAEEWLVMDPFSVTAYADLGNVAERNGSTRGSVSQPGPLSKDEIVDALLAINPDDTAVLVYAVSWSKTPSAAKSYLENLKGTDGYRAAAFNFANSNLADMDSRLEFLRDMKITPDLAILKMQALVLLLNEGSKKYTWADFRKVAADEGSFDRLRTFLDKSDSIFAVGWADKLFHFFMDAKDDVTAQKWRDYRTKRRSNDARFKALVGPGQPQEAGNLLMVP